MITQKVKYKITMCFSSSTSKHTTESNESKDSDIYTLVLIATLFLIEKKKVKITEMSIKRRTDKQIEYIQKIEYFWH